LSASSHPLLAASLTESLRTLIRRHLSAAPEGRAVLARLSGQVIALWLEPFGKLIYLCPTDEDVQILMEISGAPDVTLTGSLAAFAKAGLSGGSAESLKSANLEITGNTETARQFQALCQALKIDWQGFLSRHLGSRLTASLLDATRGGSVWLRDTLHTAETNIAEYLREEVRWLPDDAAADAWLAEVETLRADADRLESRLGRLQAAVERPGSLTPADQSS
jgi:ubiquinone biosynthesis protein UbiJ